MRCKQNRDKRGWTCPECGTGCHRFVEGLEMYEKLFVYLLERSEICHVIIEITDKGDLKYKPMP